MTDFYQRVYEIVRGIPIGRVSTYGQIAARIGAPRAARMVGMALRSTPSGSDVPWHRVINSKGIISIENLAHPPEEQANLLMAEGVLVRTIDGMYTIDLPLYLWQPQLVVDKGETL